METTLNQVAGTSYAPRSSEVVGESAGVAESRAVSVNPDPAEQREMAFDDPAEEDGWTDPRWKIISTLLAYPGSAAFPRLLADAEEWVSELILSDDDGTLSKRPGDLEPLLTLIRRMKVCEERDLESEYTRYFDFQSSTCLYLTAHELGDSRKRGLALVALRRMLSTAGFEEDGTELPDYLPLLFEFLAAKPADFDATDLEIRLARVIHVITETLPGDSVYREVFSIAASCLPDANLPDGGFVFANRESTDLDELPYPLQYD